MHNLFELYQQTDGFTKPTGTRLGRAALRFFDSLLERPTTLHVHKDDDVKIKVFEIPQGFRMDIRDRKGKLLEEQQLIKYHTMFSFEVKTLDDQGKNIRVKERYVISGNPPVQRLKLRELSKRGGEADDMTVEYDTTDDGKTYPSIETKFHLDTDIRREQTYYNEHGIITFHATYDPKGDPLTADTFEPDKGATRTSETYKDGQLVSQLSYGPEGKLKTKKESVDGKRTIISFYDDDGKTLLSTRTEKGGIPQNEIFYHPMPEDEPEGIRPIPKTRRLYQDGKRYKEIELGEDGRKIAGETSFDPATGHRTHQWLKHEQTGDHFDYRYDPETGRLKTEEMRVPPHSGQGNTLEAMDGIGPLRERTEYHADGKTPRMVTEFTDEEVRMRGRDYFANGEPRTEIKYDDEGHLEARAIVAKGTEKLIYEASYDPTKTGSRKASETLYFSPDPAIKEIEKDFFESGRVKTEVVHYHNGDKSELNYYDMKPQRVAQEVLFDTGGEIKVRRFYDKEGKRKPNAQLDIGAESDWKNRIEVRESSRVFGQSSKTMLTEVTQGLRHDGYEAILKGEVGLLLQGAKDQLLIAKRKIEKRFPKAVVTLEAREQLGEQTGNYHGGGATWVSFKEEHMMYGLPRKKVDVLSVKLPYDQEKEWPQTDYSLGPLHRAPAFYAEVLRAKEVLTDLVKQVHSYTDCDLGIQLKADVYKHGSYLQPVVKIYSGFAGSAAPDRLYGEVVMETVRDVARKKNLGTGMSWSDQSVVLICPEISVREHIDAEKRAKATAEEMASKVAAVFHVPTGKAGGASL
ncbi:MAG: hypothetical protein K2Q01_09700 [Rickettsiales bacterium]|nr:hypothetical protein [Rickettsiales bacterium]